MSSKEVIEPIKNQPNYELVERIEPFKFVRCRENGYFQLESICYLDCSALSPEKSEEQLLKEPFVQEIITLIKKDVEQDLFLYILVDPFPGYYIHPKLVNPIASFLSPVYFTKLYHPRLSTKSNVEFDDDEYSFARFFSPYSFIIHQKDNYIQLESIIRSFNITLTTQQVLEIKKIKLVFTLIQDELTNKFKKDNEPIIKVISKIKSPLTNGTYVHPCTHAFIIGYLSPEILVRMSNK